MQTTIGYYGPTGAFLGESEGPVAPLWVRLPDGATADDVTITATADGEWVLTVAGQEVGSATANRPDDMA